MSETCRPRKRNAGLILGGIVAIVLGVLALILAVRGFQGKGGAVDVTTAWPNALTGVMSLAGGIAYLAQRKEAVMLYALATLGHFVSHGMVLFAHGGAPSPGAALSLAGTPLLSLLLLGGIVNCRRCGRLA